MAKKEAAEPKAINFNVPVPEAGEGAIITFPVEDCEKLVEALKVDGLWHALDKINALDIAAIRAAARIGLKGGDVDRLERSVPLEEIAAKLFDGVLLRVKGRTRLEAELEAAAPAGA